VKNSEHVFLSEKFGTCFLSGKFGTCFLSEKFGTCFCGEKIGQCFLIALNFNKASPEKLF
jgi:hypothetical protein